MKNLFRVLCVGTFIPAALSAQSGWNTLTSGTTTDLHAIHFANVDTGFAAGASGTVLKTTNAGASWQNVSPTGFAADLNGVFAFSEMPGRVVVVGAEGLALLSTDGGVSWDTVATEVTDELLCVSFSGEVGVAGGRSQTIVRSTNAGALWSEVQSGFFGGGFWDASMLTQQIGYVCGENSIFQPLLGATTDGGVSWEFTPFYLDNNEGRAYAVEFTDLQTGHVAAGVWDGRGAMVRTTNGGVNWATQFVPAPLYSLDFPASATGFAGYAVGASGRIIKTSDGGSTWQQQTSGTSGTLRAVCFLDINNGYVAGEGGIILKTTTGGEPPSGVIEEPVPGSFMLLQNHPNPFNPATKILFSLPSTGGRVGEGSRTSLRVFDLLGREVATLVDGIIEPGTHAIVFDSRVHGNLPSGTYFARLSAAGVTRTIRMSLLK